MPLITVYHEWAHEYAIQREVESGYVFSCPNAGEQAPTAATVSGRVSIDEALANDLLYTARLASSHSDILDLLFLLADKVESENPYAVTDDFLNNLGYTAIETQLFHEDYTDEVGWRGEEA